MALKIPPGKVVFAGLPLDPTDCETHFLLLGSTGSGKTITLRILAQSVLPRVQKNSGCRAMIYDAKQDMLPLLSAFCDRSRIFTFNPYDDRGVALDIGADVCEPRIAHEAANVLFPKRDVAQPFFEDAARALGNNVMNSFWLSGIHWTLGDLLRALDDSRRCRRILERHPETSHIVEQYYGNKRVLKDIFTTVSSRLDPYRSVAACWDAAKRRISLREWMAEEMILILGNAALGKAALELINRCILEIAVDLIRMLPEGTNKETWVIVDEATSANCLHPLPTLATEGRSKKAHLVIGVQTVGGLRDPKVFGPHVSENFLGQFGNRLFARMECPETAEFASRVIGDAEVRQTSGSRTQSFKGGATTTTNWTPTVRRAVLPSEFMSIPACNAANGLTALFTTRSSNPTWDHIPGNILFERLLIPPATDVPTFVPRDPKLQLLKPWTPEEEAKFAPPLSPDQRRRRRRREQDLDDPDLKSPTKDIDDPELDDDLFR